jgi:hypothetical protein
MNGVFISYRRDDAPGYAGRLYDRLAAHFGADRVFMDVQGIEPGVDFVEAIERALVSCEILIVLIGKDWLAADAAGRCRLDDPTDFVRLETATALARGIRVVPVLVEGATMPSADRLPQELLPLVRRQAVELSHKQWDATSAELIRTLEKILDRDKPRAAGIAPANVARTPPQAAAPIPQPEPPLPPAARRPVALYWGLGALLLLIAATALYLTHPWRRDIKPAAPAVLTVIPERVEINPAAVTKAPPAAATTAPAPDKAPPAAVTAAPTPDKAGPPPATSAPAPEVKPEVAAVPPKILRFESRLVDGKVQLCYGVENAASATITPEPGAVKPLAQECVTVAGGARKTYTLSARGPTGLIATRAISVEAPAQPQLQLATVPSIIGKSRRDAIAEVEKAGLKAQVVESKPDPKSPAAADSVLAQSPKGGEQVKAGERVTLEVVPAPAAVAALPSAFPHVGDSWQYDFKSIWKNVEPRTFTHQVTAVSDREVRETMSFVTSGGKISDSKSLGAESRFVEWRGQGYYFVEFNPFLQAFGALQPGTTWKSLVTPVEDPFFSDWYSQGRVIGWDSVSMPAGSFKALRVEVTSSRNVSAGAAAQGAPARIYYVIWYAPEAKRTVKHVRTVLKADGTKLAQDTYELVKYAVQ